MAAARNSNKELVPASAIPGDRLAYFREYKDAFDAEYEQVFDKEVSVDLLNYMTKLPRSNQEADGKIDVVNIRAVFEYLKSRIDTKVVRGRSINGSGEHVEFRFERASVAANRTTGFDEPRTTGPADDGEQENLIEWMSQIERKVIAVPSNASKKALNVGVQGSLVYPQSDTQYSVSMWVWNSGMIRIVLGVKKETAKHAKTLEGTSEMLTVAPRRYEAILKDAFLLLWGVTAARGIQPARLQQIGDPAALPWTVLNMSVTSALRRPWSTQLDYTPFKVIYSLLLDSRISTEEYNEGILITARHDRHTSNDSYFMIYLFFAQFSDLFETHQQHTLIDRDAGKYKINSFKINPEHWTAGKKAQIPKGLRGSEPIRQAIFNTADSSLHISGKDIMKPRNGADAPNEVVLYLRTDALPKFTIKFYHSGTVQMNSTTAFPWYNLWRGMSLVTRGLTKTGISWRLRKMARTEEAAFSWVNAYEHKPIVDVTKVIETPPPRKGVQDTLGHRGRKAGPTCKGLHVPLPEGSGFNGHCHKDLGDGFIVMPNKFGDPCCAKYSIKNKKKVTDAYRREKVPIPPHVAEALGIPAGPVFDGNGDDSGGTGYVVDFHPQKGLLRINARTSGHNMPLLERAAKQLSIPVQYKSKGQIRPKDKKELMRDIAIHILKAKGLPSFPEATREAAIQHIMEMVLPALPRQLDQMNYADKARYLFDYVREHHGGTTNNNGASGARLVTSPTYQDDEFSPAERQHLRRPQPRKNANADNSGSNYQNNGNYDNRLSQPHKEYLVLDALFGFSSYDIPRFPTIKT